MTNKISITFGEIDFTFLTETSLFSPSGLDLGSRLLLETVKIPTETQTILDLGCGYGAIGIILAKFHPDKFVYLLDKDPQALFLAERNSKLNAIKNIKILKADVTKTSLPHRVDLVLSNPPWTRNLTVIPNLVEFAYTHLNSGGRFYVVVNKTFQTEFLMERTFGNVQEIGRKDPYKILVSQKNELLANDLLEDVKKKLSDFKITPDPLKSQYFLTDSNIIREIVRASDLKKSDRTLEIGPGLGSITRKIADGAKQVTAIEIDSRFKPILRSLPQNVSIVYGDFFKEYRERERDFKFNKVVGNLPFTAASSILHKLQNKQFDLGVFILPEKFASKILVSNQYPRFKISKLFPISRSFFYPMPDVDSTVVRIVKN